MFGLNELKRLSAREGVPQGVVEKDYVLSVALKAIADSDLSKYIVFKGGTAIRKAYFPEARYSEDLDFNSVGVKKEGIFKSLRQALDGKGIGGVDFGKVEEEQTTAGLKASVKYTGQLEYSQRIRFDFNFRENLVETPVVRSLIDVYGIGGAEMKIMGLSEIFAEKLHALGSRSAPRDLYDAWFLFGKGVKVDKSVLDKKFAYYDETFDANVLLANAEQNEQNWSKDLRHLLKKLPEFRKVFGEVKEKIKAIS